MKPAWKCLPPAVLSVLLGAFAAPHAARAASTAFAVQGDEVSLRRTDASQFMDGSPGASGNPERPARPATTSDSIRVGPGSDEPTTIVYGSDPDTDHALATALTVASGVLCVVAIFAVCHAMSDAFHSATPLDLGAGR